MPEFKKYLPNLADPKNEVAIYVGWTYSLYLMVEPLITDESFTTRTGFTAFLAAVFALFVRSQVSSKKTVAQLAA